MQNGEAAIGQREHERFATTKGRIAKGKAAFRRPFAFAFQIGRLGQAPFIRH